MKRVGCWILVIGIFRPRRISLWLSLGFGIWLLGFIIGGCGQQQATTGEGATGWVLEEGIRLADAVSTSTVKLPDGTYRMYYVGAGGINTATSSDGLNFTKEKTSLISKGASGEPDSQGPNNPCVVRLSDGYRMYYEGWDGSTREVTDPLGGTRPASTNRRIMSAVSTDGLTFTKEGIRVETKGDSLDNGTASVPDIIRLSDGSWVMAYVYDMYGANSIRIATSSDEGNSISTPGTWVKQSIVGLGQNAMDPDMVLTTDGKIKMYYAQPTGMPGSQMNIISATSSDGLSWTKDSGIVISPTHYPTINIAGDPDVVEISSGTYRMYYYEFKTETQDASDIFSARYQ